MEKKFKCKNFETCENYTNSEHSKWCQYCSYKWQFKQMGYDFYAELDDGEIQGIILIREDLNDERN